jgi:hypothetical protein
LNTTLITVVSPISTTTSASATPQPYTFHIEISNQRQHAGAWFGTYIRDDIKDVLHKQCNSETTGANTCKTDKDKFTNIEYSNKYGAVEKGKSAVNVHVESDDFLKECNKNGGL